jgi:hypothetical protein
METSCTKDNTVRGIDPRYRNSEAITAVAMSGTLRR